MNMVNGGGDVGREPQIAPQNTTRTRISTSNRQYGHAVSRIAITQILESIGFENSYHRPIDSLADLMIRYISYLGKLSISCSNLSGRTNCNVFDVFHALEEIESVHGFTGQSDPLHCLSSSGVFLDLHRFVRTRKEVPFARVIAGFPVKHKKKVETFQDTGEDTGDEEVAVASHVPGWLPPFPDPITCINSSISIENSELNQQMERPHFSFRKFFSLSSSDEFAPVSHTNVERENEAGQSNPFLVPPLPHGERHVSDITIPSERKGISVIETFAPIIEASGGGGEIIEERGAIPNKRPVIRFTIGAGAKSISKVLSLRDNTGIKEDYSWTVKEEEMDSKKRRAEMILKESMEKPNELAQL